MFQDYVNQNVKYCKTHQIENANEKNFETIAEDANFAGFKSVYDTMKLFSNGMRGAMSS